MSTIRSLREKRDSYIATARRITETAVHDNRDLTAEEKRDFDGLTAKIDAINETLKRHNLIADLRDEMDKPINDAIRPNVGGGDYRDVRPGEVRMVKPSERLTDIYGHGGDDLSIGRIVRGIATGDWRGAELERRAMNDGTGSAGGYMVPTSLSLTLIDMARKQSVLMNAAL